MRLVILWLIFGASVNAQDSWIGRKVMERHGAKVLNGSRTIPLDELKSPLVVAAVRGEWLDVGPGFIRKSDVVYLEDAPAYYTEYLRSNPQSSWAYIQRGIAWNARGEADIAMKDYSEAIRINSTSSAAYNNRGIIRSDKGDLEGALRDYEEAIRLDPTDDSTYTNRGNLFRNTKKWQSAIESYNEAIRLAPSKGNAYGMRGVVRRNMGEFDKALSDYTAAIRLDPHEPVHVNNRSWLRATCPDARFRDGNLAVEDGIKACEISNWKNRNYLDTLAAAYAEQGDFAKAVEWEKKAIELAPAAERSGLEAHLKLFQEGQPYRQKEN